MQEKLKNKHFFLHDCALYFFSSFFLHMPYTKEKLKRKVSFAY